MVVECGHDSRFIIAKRQGLTLKDENGLQEPDPGVFDYWIIDTSLPAVFGPLTLDGFTQKRMEFGVPSDLEMKDALSFRPES